jgi:hypothetical protein
MSGRTLPLKIEKQVEKEWCWAAVSASVHKFLLGIAQTQCEVASAVLNRKCCTEAASSKECNHPWAIEPVLRSYGLLRLGDPVEQLTFDEIRTEIDAGHPIPVLIKWMNNGQIGPDGHFITITGYRVTPGNKHFVAISDPLYSFSEYEFSHFTSKKGGYRDGLGVWTATFRVRKKAAA